jgi:hypothetical protein
MIIRWLRIRVISNVGGDVFLALRWFGFAFRNNLIILLSI